ncbi:hypothetical protein [Saccharothrix australiensis]|uniref:hypothetical protein n=1 Tax=Saccharothrix australiensis TaxID=2072 RepID=UPI0011C40087|nr:hypothetical protein [Saccharothrix australiensis]
MPQLGAIAVSSAALRNCALALHAAPADRGVHVATLTIGGLVERGDIFEHVRSRPERLGEVGDSTLDPDAIADAAWRLHTRRDRAEEVFSAFG